MTNVASIELDAGTLDRSEVSGQLTAGIWLSVNGQPFPGERWDDFVMNVLTWWTDALTRLLRRESDRERVHFMDGPYSVEVVRPDRGPWHITLREDQQSGNVDTEAIEVNPRLLVESVISADNLILAACDSRGWDVPEAGRLGSALRELRGLSPGGID